MNASHVKPPDAVAWVRDLVVGVRVLSTAAGVMGAAQKTMEDPGILALPADLMFASKIRAAAGAVGAAVGVHARPEALLEAARRYPPHLVLIDLDARRWDPTALVRDLKQDARTSAARVVAFVTHTRLDAIDAARSAGADRVLARSAFVRELPSILTTSVG